MPRAAQLAAGAIRGVTIGIAVTAFVQVLIAGAGLLLAATPGALLLSAAILFLCLAQLGPGLIMIPAVIWEFHTGSPLRPVLIRRGADLPLPLIFTGVIGGMIGMGIMGIFLGPVVLAVAYDLLADWVENRSEPEAEAPSGVPVKPTMAA